MNEPLQVVEYRHGEVIEWDTLLDCAKAHRVSSETIKRMIMTGGCLDGHSTFDVAMHSLVDLFEENGKLVLRQTSFILPVRQTRIGCSERTAVHRGVLHLDEQKIAL